jgi:hypothetical protein
VVLSDGKRLLGRVPGPVTSSMRSRPIDRSRRVVIGRCGKNPGSRPRQQVAPRLRNSVKPQKGCHKPGPRNGQMAVIPGQQFRSGLRRVGQATICIAQGIERRSKPYVSMADKTARVRFPYGNGAVVSSKRQGDCKKRRGPTLPASHTGVLSPSVGGGIVETWSFPSAGLECPLIRSAFCFGLRF